MKSPITLKLLLSLLDDFKRLEPSLKGFDRDKVTIEARFKHEGRGFLTFSLPRFCDALDKGLADSKFACPHGFKKVRGGALPAFMQGLLCEVFETKTGQLKEQPNIRAIKCLREALRLFKKVRIDSAGEEVLHRDAVRTFWDADGSCGTDTISGPRGYLLSYVSRYVLANLGQTKIAEVLPRHGPGAVAEGLYGNQKWSSICNALSSVATEQLGFDLFRATDFRGTEQARDIERDHGEATSLSRDYERDPPEFGIGYPLATSSARSSRLVSVPKDVKSRRTITVEPCWNMFFQQGLNAILREHIAKDRILSNCLDLVDQSKNQNLAMVGSITGEWSTLDLKSASDLLSLKLVEAVFAPISQDFFSWMSWCRTPGVDNKTLKKFAGMGNALTFPVQSVVFAMIAITAIASKSGRRPNYRDVVRSSRCLRVYGDDIIVRKEDTDLVVDWIESFGLRINRTKSFTTGNFRESCGVDAYKGVDVTPVYVRADPDDSSYDPSSVANLVAVSNNMWERGLYAASTILKDAVEERLGYSLPMVSHQSSGLGWTCRTGAVEVSRWDPKLHQWLVKAPVIIPVKRNDPLDDWPALLKFFLTPLIERNGEHLKKTIMRFRNRIKRKWIPAQAGLSSL